MRISRRLAACGALVSLAVVAWASDGSRAELPLGPYVRPGRPVVVRVSGADRVRTESSPWALPQGHAGDEFVLQTLDAGLGPFELEIDRDGELERVALAVEALPRAGTLRASFGGSDARGAYVIPTSGLPTVPEAWLLFDAIGEAPDALAPPVREALAAHRRRRPFTSGRWCQPLLDPPDLAPFRLLAAASSAAPVLPRDVVWAACLVGGTCLLLLLLGRRGSHAGVRLVRTAAPGACFVAWALGSGALPGDVRAHALVLEGPERSLVLVRVAALRAAQAEFALPPGASSPALLRFDPSDRSVRAAEAGRVVRLDLSAGEHRVLAYSVPSEEPVLAPTPVPGPVEEPAVELSRFLRARGLVPRGAVGSTPRWGALPASAGATLVPAGTYGVEPGN